MSGAAGITGAAAVSLTKDSELLYTHPDDFPLALKPALPPEPNDDTQLHENCPLNDPCVPASDVCEHQAYQHIIFLPRKLLWLAV